MASYMPKWDPVWDGPEPVPYWDGEGWSLAPALPLGGASYCRFPVAWDAIEASGVECLVGGFEQVIEGLGTARA